MRKILAIYKVAFLLLIGNDVNAKETWELSLLYSPNASYDYSAEGNNYPPSYTANFSGMQQPINGLEAIHTLSAKSRLGFLYLQAGSSEFDDECGIESVGDYQTSKLNVGFTNFMVSYYKKIEGIDAEFMMNFSIMRQMFSRRDFTIDGVNYSRNDDNEISGEGIGFGIKGETGDPLFVRGKVFTNFYAQIHDIETDAEMGTLFSYELSAGYKYKGAVIEAGYLCLYSFMHSQTNRRLYLGNDDAQGAIISWSQQDMTAKGAFLRINFLFD